MRIGTGIGYANGMKEAAKRVADLESAGVDVVWVAEAYGVDGVSLMGYLAAITERVQIGSGILPIYSRTPTLTATSRSFTITRTCRTLTIGIGIESGTGKLLARSVEWLWGCLPAPHRTSERMRVGSCSCARRPTAHGNMPRVCSVGSDGPSETFAGILRRNESRSRSFRRYYSRIRVRRLNTGAGTAGFTYVVRRSPRPQPLAATERARLRRARGRDWLSRSGVPGPCLQGTGAAREARPVF